MIHSYCKCFIQGIQQIIKFAYTREPLPLNKLHKVELDDYLGGIYCNVSLPNQTHSSFRLFATMLYTSYHDNTRHPTGLLVQKQRISTERNFYVGENFEAFHQMFSENRWGSFLPPGGTGNKWICFHPIS